MILNETYDEILERLDKYSINEGFFGDRKKKSTFDPISYCKNLQEKYNSWIKNPTKLSDTNYDILTLVKWNNYPLNKLAGLFIKNNNAITISEVIRAT